MEEREDQKRYENASVQMVHNVNSIVRMQSVNVKECRGEATSCVRDGGTQEDTRNSYQERRHQEDSQPDRNFF